MPEAGQESTEESGGGDLSRKIGLGLLALCAVVVLASLSTQPLLARIEREQDACLEGVIEAAPQEAPRPEQCVGGWRLRAAELSPLTRERALELRRAGELEAARISMRYAGRVRLDAEQREAALARVVERSGPLDLELGREIVGAGGAAVLPAQVLAAPAETASLHVFAAAEATLSADFETLTRLHALEAGLEDRHGRSSGAAWLCLYSGPRAAAPRLEQAGAATGDPRIPDLLNELCGDAKADGEGGWIAARRSRRSGEAGAWLDAHPERWNPPVFAQAVLDHRTLPADLDRWSGRAFEGESGMLRGSDRLAALVSFSSGDLSSLAPPMYDPATLREAAGALVACPPELEHSSCNRSRAVAGLLAAEAGAEWLRRGRELEAREAASAALEWLPPAQQAWAVAILVRAGGADAGLAWLKTRDRLEHAELELIALTKLERWQAASEDLAARLAEAEAEARPAIIDVLTRWKAALDARAKSGELEGGSAAGALPLEHWADFHAHVNPAFVTALSQPGQARIARWVPGAAKLSRSRPTLDLVVLALAAGAEGDVEAWLDLHVVEEFVDHGPALIRARAEAARWRGDAQAEARWRELDATLRALAGDEDDELLLWVATR